MVSQNSSTAPSKPQERSTLSSENLGDGGQQSLPLASNEGDTEKSRIQAEPTTPGVRYDRYVIFRIIKNLLVKLVKVIHVICLLKLPQTNWKILFRGFVLFTDKEKVAGLHPVLYRIFFANLNKKADCCIYLIYDHGNFMMTCMAKIKHRQ